MVQFTYHQPSSWALLFISTIWVAGSTAESLADYPNPFAPKDTAQQPLAAQSTGATGGTGATSSDYPNPFLSAGGTGGTGGTGSDYPNPFGGGGTGCTGTGQNAASLDPANVAGTCCCDSKKTFVVASPAPPAGGCCAKGNKWGCGCQDGGSFAYNPLACPVLHRNTRITPSGPKFDLYCNVQTQRKDLKVEPADSFIECVDACGATAGCFGVDFNKVTKQCHLKSEYMDENTQGAANNDVDSASMPPLACPDINGQVHTIGGVQYKMWCDGSVTSLTAVYQDGVNTLEACAQKCSLDPKCQGANLRLSDKNCFLHYLYQNPPQGTEPGWMTMVPISQR